jgi:pimeloyl-ACP methyl ester carboxylesterase
MMRRINVEGLELALQDEGDGPPVLLLHGFPDSSRLWRGQIPALTGAGLRVLAPDLRGFGESGKPEAVAEYRVGRSVADLVAMLDALAIDRVAVVGHDWGAGVAWALALSAPERVERLVAMSVGHPALRATRTLEDRQMAWYQLLFQFPEAEAIVMRDDWRLFRAWAASHPDLDEAIAALSRPGALTAGLNWYRANLHPAGELRPAPAFAPVQAPVLGMWSTGDAYLSERGLVGSAEHVAGPWRYERIEGAGHWLQRDATERVNELLADFLT